MGQQAEAGSPINLAATGTISKSSGALLGFFVNSTSSGTLVFRTGLAGAGGTGSTVITGTITPAAGIYHRLPAYCVDGLHVTVANTINATFFFAAG